VDIGPIHRDLRYDLRPEGSIQSLMRRLALALAALTLLALPGTALARDRDHDGLPDRWEAKHHLSLKHASAGADPDRDHVDNWNEYREGTDPRNRDSDGDHRADGREDRDRDGLSNAGEDATGNDPRDRDTDDDGVRDGREQAGTVSSFGDDGTLRIALASGGTVSGLVTDFTEIRCRSKAESEGHHRKAAARASSLEEDPGEDPAAPGDETGDQGDAPADDPGEDSGDELDADPGDPGLTGGQRRCSEAALMRGAHVHEAQLEQTPDGLAFTHVDLLR
jgi:hypothetical protein